MKFLLILILSFPFTLIAFGQALPDSGFTNKAEAKNLLVNGLKEGKWVEYLNSGKNYIKDTNGAEYYCLSIYDTGKANGIQRYYSKKGILLNISPIKNGKREGIVKEYYDSKKLLGTYPTSP